MNIKTLPLFIILLLFSTYFFSQNSIKIKNINPVYNNKKIAISSVSNDLTGNIWMANSLGILKYNGYSYTLIKNTDVFPEISSSDRVYEMYSDKEHNIWIRSLEGLVSKYNSKTGVFIPIYKLLNEKIRTIKPIDNGLILGSNSGKIYTYFNENIKHICTIPNINGTDKRILDLEFDGNTTFFISDNSGKIYTYNKNSKNLKELVNGFIDFEVNTILQMDNYNKLWIGTDAQGFFIYDTKENKFIEKKFLKGAVNKLDKELFISIFKDSFGIIWAGTDGGGLYKMDSKTGLVEVFKHTYPSEFTLGSNTILSVSEDLNNNIWIVCNFQIINVIPKTNPTVNFIPGSADKRTTRVLSLHKSKNGTLWVGTDGNGLSELKNNKQSKQYFNDINNNFYVQCITEDDYGNIWFGTYRNGIWKYNTRSKSFKKIPLKNKQNQFAIDVRLTFKDSKGRIWVGSNVALNVYDKNEKLIASFNNRENGLDGFSIETALEDENNVLWFGQQFGGLFRFDEAENLQESRFANFDNGKINGEIRVIDMVLGKKNEIWFINEKLKLILFNTVTKEFKDFKDSYQNKTLNFTAINTLDRENFWLSSIQGVHHFNSKTKKILSYYSTDGFQENRYFYRSTLTNNGNIYFGGEKGINYFNPLKLEKMVAHPQLSISDITILNQPARDIIPNQISSNNYDFKEITLKNNQSSFSVKFAAIDNILNPNFLYSYRLKGFEEEWKTTYSEGIATYTNIPDGTYTLEIKAKEINQTTATLKNNIHINILPPFWKTWWACLIYLLLFTLLVLVFFKWYGLRKKFLINRISRRKEKELHSEKMNFFTKMSHEIQTPITLIIGPIEDMLKRAEMNGNLLLEERLNIIRNNAVRLSRIAKELTLVKNKDLKRLKLSVTENDLYTDINSICLSFKEIARSKKIDFSVNCPKNIESAWYDKEKLEHILYNIIGNAFKFTPVEGNIQVIVKPVDKKNNIKISISDSGVGIPKSDLEDIFKLFYRSKNKTKAKGTGIGLALTKELVDLHKAKIKVNSSKSEGTTFTLKISISEENYTDEEKITSSKKIGVIDEANITNKDNKVVLKKNSDPNSNKTILIVEDNFELQNFIKDLLSDQYNILQAENGKEGFYYAKNNIPDLIISDIMMPEMDGIELCQALNKDNLTKHIPVILLTAKNSTQSKITGLKAGALEYINKPFNTNELLLKVNNIINSKDSIISKYRKELISRPSIKLEQSQDEIFLENLNKIVNENLNDANFKVDSLAEKLNMSHSSLYRKCSNLTGLSLIDYIRQMRLKKGAIILVKYGYNISEVAYMVGFNNPKYFSKSFKSQFGKSPKEFKSTATSTESIEEFLEKNNIDFKNFNEA
ncbi:response regulator [Polaribacter haliotis]|uniref:histidine kinase n=1 Tax=Polaribacter haliotis TaxID=1888915 RepID=A0A7L8AK62_9FLAO|nr:response regulator [Polaribacter haliotis]QOD62344.1 response regulator [Polaribacter haliotis]